MNTTTARYLGISLDTQACANCRHFYQHYILDPLSGGRYCVPVHSGHCCYPRFKYRKVSDVCEHFERTEDDEEKNRKKDKNA